MSIEVNNKAAKENTTIELDLLLKSMGFITYTQKTNDIYETIFLQEEHSLDDIKANPYLLIPFYSFYSIDKLIKKNSLLLQDSHYRIRISILSELNRMFIEKGDTAFKKNELLLEVLDKTELDSNFKTKVLREIDALIIKGFVKQLTHNTMITSKKYHNIELFISETLNTQSSASKGNIISDSDINRYIDNEEKKSGFKLDVKQRDIILLANKQYSIFSLNGYAGSGKTTSSTSVLNLYASKYGKDSIICCALSGVAANRAKMVTGYNGSTVHSLLGYDGTNFRKNETDRLSYSLVMLDEAGMIDSELFYRLLKAIDFKKTTLMIVGDNAQLQSVGNGDIYNNILSLNLCKTITLDRVFRQKEEQVINIIAQSIRKANKPLDYLGDNFEDFRFYSAMNENIIDVIKDISMKHTTSLNKLLLSEQYSKFMTAFQVIAPVKRNVFGTYNLNNILQNIFNPIRDINKVTIKNKDKTTDIKTKDRVIHLINRNMHTMDFETYKANEQEISKIKKFDEARVFNGQMGIVLKIDLDANSGRGAIYVLYPDNNYVAIYTKNDIVRQEVLDLAYAITVHKSQGSQYDTVVMPMVAQYTRMLNNKLLYTAVTRAKDMLCIVGERITFERGCTNNSATERDTVISNL